MHLAGLKHYLITDVGFYHKESATGQTVVTPDHWNLCENYYKFKWGGIPGEEKYDHPFNDKNNNIDYWRK
jgi:hypothetical protein